MSDKTLAQILSDNPAAALATAAAIFYGVQSGGDVGVTQAQIRDYVFNSHQSTTSSQIIQSWTPSDYNASGDPLDVHVGKFNWAICDFDVNAAGNPVDSAFAYGYNVNVGSIAQVSGEYAFGTWLECAYLDPPNDQVEWYLQGIDRAGNSVRPIGVVFRCADGGTPGAGTAFTVNVPMTVSSTVTFDDTLSWVHDNTEDLGTDGNRPRDVYVGRHAIIGGDIQLKGSSSGTITIQGAADAGTWTLTLPTSNGTPDQILSTDGNGVTSWIDQPSGGSVGAGGSNTQVQFNDGGSIAGSALFKFDKTTGALYLEQQDSTAVGVGSIFFGDPTSNQCNITAYNNQLYVVAYGARCMSWSSEYVRVADHISFQWSNNNGYDGTPDVGFSRASAGTIQCTDGSTGLGTLIFMLPTADPHIAGAWWDNAGTPAKSAG